MDCAQKPAHLLASVLKLLIAQKTEVGMDEATLMRDQVL